MNKFLIAAIGLVFLLGSSATMASGNKESELPPMAAQDILNQMACDGKKAGEKFEIVMTVKWLLAQLRLNNLILANNNYKQVD